METKKKIKAKKKIYTISSVTDDKRFGVLNMHFKETSTKAYAIRKEELKHAHPKKDDRLVFFETDDGTLLKVELNGQTIHTNQLFSEEAYELEIEK